MNSISLYIPNLEDYWYEKKILSDPLTMSYNSGFDVSYDGYHYDTGCIDFPKDKWEQKFCTRHEENNYFAYIKDISSDSFVGYVNYNYNKNDNRYYCGIVIEAKYRGKGYSKMALRLLCDVAKSNGIKELYDSFEIDRNNALYIFKKIGFEVVSEQKCKRFDKMIDVVLIKIIL